VSVPAASWVDIFGILLSTMAIVVTIAAIYVAWLLSQNYVRTVEELQEIRSSTHSMAAKIGDVSNFNSALLRESMLAVRVIFDWMMAVERRDAHVRALDNLLASREWKGRLLDDIEIDNYLKRISEEISRTRKEIVARETELYWLVGREVGRESHLHALITTNGDQRSLSLLSDIMTCKIEQVDKDELVVAIAALRQRLGFSAVSSIVRVRSAAWTGRTAN
jgi:hypothetical protein